MLNTPSSADRITSVHPNAIVNTLGIQDNQLGMGKLPAAMLNPNSNKAKAVATEVHKFHNFFVALFILFSP